jgi:serine/threonine protein kinase
MGAVYEAEEIGTGRRVALKLIKAEFASSADAVERFRQEGRIASMVAHPRCVFVLAVDEEAGLHRRGVMPGNTLKSWSVSKGRWLRTIAKILDVIEGLQAAHRLAVIHRDVKPSNRFLEADGRVKVGDFGLAKSLVQDSHITKTGAFVGTPHFASPSKSAASRSTCKRTSIRWQPHSTICSRASRPSPATTRPRRWRGSIRGRTTLAEPASGLSPALERVVLRGLGATATAMGRSGGVSASAGVLAPSHCREAVS